MIGKPMTSGSPWVHILKFTFPVLAGSLLQQLYQTADTVIVGNFTGERALAAVGTTNTLNFLLLSVAIGFSSGNGVVSAQHFGAGLLDRVRKDASTGILLLGALGLLLSAAAIIFSRAAYKYAVNVPPDILPETLTYFRIYALGLVFQFLYNELAAILRSVGDSAATLYFLLIASVLNILLDLLFVGFFDWGVAGAAWATNTAQAVSVLAAWFYMRNKYPVFRFKLRELIWSNSAAKDTVKTGYPIALQLIFVALGLTFIQRAANGFGQAMTAAFAVGQRIEMYMHLPCNALQITLANFTGQNMGAGNLDRVRQGARQGVVISAFFTLLISIPVWCSAGILPGFFALSDTAASYCTSYLRSISLVVVILSLYVPLFGFFQGIKRSFIPTIAALCALSLRVAATYLFKDSGYFGHTIIWWNAVFGFSTGCILSYIFCSRTMKKLQSGKL